MANNGSRLGRQYLGHVIANHRGGVSPGRSAYAVKINDGPTRPVTILQESGMVAHRKKVNANATGKR